MDSHSRGQSIKLMIKQLGEVYDLTKDENVTNIEVNSRNGKVFKDGVGGRKNSYTGIKLSEERRKTFLSAAASYHGGVIDDEHPSISMSLPAALGSCRLEGQVWPVVKKPSFALRKPSKEVFPITDYANEQQIKLIRSAIKNRENILIAGSTDSGKTSLLKSILHLYKDICPYERMITIEDTEELLPVLDNTESFFTAPHLKSSKGEPMDMQFMLKKTLRKNPDRIIIGEVRDNAALTVLHSWDTGHNGGICTFHAGGAKNGYYRFFGSLAGLDEEKTAHVRMATSNINYVFYINKNIHGQRRIEEIVKVSYDRKNQTPAFKEVTFTS